MISRTITINSDGSVPARKTFCDKEYLVVPLVAIVEGVLVPGNIGEPELALMKYFEESLDSWNGRPVLLNHPVRNGLAISANVPEAYESQAFGMLFNSEIKDKKLLTEAWIDLARAKQLGGDFQSCVDRLDAGEVIEVSTGLRCDSLAAKGKYNGKNYVAVWQNIQPDHLAMLPDAIGACSVDDGCGANRANAANVDCKIVLTGNQHTCENNCDDPLTCKCKVVTDDAVTVANQATSDEAKALAIQTAIAQTATENKANTIKALSKFFIRENSEGISDNDLRTSIGLELGDGNSVVAVFDKSVVFLSWYDYAIYEVPYTADDTGDVELDLDQLVSVRPLTQFVTISEDEGSTTMAMSEADKTAKEAAEKLAKQAAANVAKTVAVTEIVTTEDLSQLLQLAGSSLTDSIKSAMALRDNERAKMITKIKANKRNKFNDVQLGALPFDQLENLVELATEPTATTTTLVENVNGNVDRNDLRNMPSQPHQHAAFDFRGNAGGEQENGDENKVVRVQTMSERLKSIKGGKAA